MGKLVQRLNKSHTVMHRRECKQHSHLPPNTQISVLMTAAFSYSHVTTRNSSGLITTLSCFSVTTQNFSSTPAFLCKLKQCITCSATVCHFVSFKTSTVISVNSAVKVYNIRTTFNILSLNWNLSHITQAMSFLCASGSAS